MTTKEISEIVDSQKEYFGAAKYWNKRGFSFKGKILDGFVTTLTGVRRSGKSTLLKQYYLQNQPCLYLHFDDPRLSNFEMMDFYRLEELFGSNMLFMFDELQQVDQWEKYIRQLTERKGKAIVTGSNASLFSTAYGTLLTGRNLAYELFPFSYKEYVEYKELTYNALSLKSYMEEGGFPEFLANSMPEILQQYYVDILHRDIINRHQIKNKEEINKIALYLVNNVARPYSMTSLKNTFGLGSVNTVSSYISYLEDAYLLFSVPLYDVSFKKQLINNKKVYAIDTGLVNQLTSKLTRDYGRLFENMIFLFLRNQSKKIFYYSNTFECDFVIQFHDQSFMCIQVCYEINSQNLKRELNGLTEALNLFDLQEGWIITFDQNDEFEQDGKKIHAIAAHQWMAGMPPSNPQFLK